MKDLVEKYYVFTLIYMVMFVAMILFRDDVDTRKYIIGAIIGVFTQPVVSRIQTIANNAVNNNGGENK